MPYKNLPAGVICKQLKLSHVTTARNSQIARESETKHIVVLEFSMDENKQTFDLFASNACDSPIECFHCGCTSSEIRRTGVLKLEEHGAKFGVVR